MYWLYNSISGTNQEFNSRNLGMRRLAELPACLVNTVVLDKLKSTNTQTTVQGLLNLANDYLAGVGFFPPKFGNLLNETLIRVNGYWANCGIHDPCSTQSRNDTWSAAPLGQASLAPNPVLDIVTLTLEVATDSDLRVRFVGSSGVQSEEVVSALQGLNSFTFSTKNFPAGLYAVVLQNGKDLQTLRMVKVQD